MLVPAPDESKYYYRKTTQSEVFYTERETLIPRTTEQAYIQFCADQLCTLAQGNVLNKILLELDPSNTYLRPTAAVPSESTEISGIPEGVSLNIMEPNPAYTWIQHTIQISFDGVTTVTYNGTSSSATVEWGATGTTPMTSKGVVAVFNGPPPASSFEAKVALVRKPSRDLMALLTQLDSKQLIVWDDRLEPYMDSTIPLTRLVAYVLNALARI